MTDDEIVTALSLKSDYLSREAAHLITRLQATQAPEVETDILRRRIVELKGLLDQWKRLYNIVTANGVLVDKTDEALRGDP